MKVFLKIIGLSWCWCAVIIVFGVFSGWITISGAPDWIVRPAGFLYHHLRLSTVPFGVLFILYGVLISKLRRELGGQEVALSNISYLNRLLDITISTFFGVGVIWTAVGMETALVHALEGGGKALQGTASQGAWVLMDRLVNGGLLLALSTTIFGGVCGYGLRLLKVVLIGRKWDLVILQEEKRHETV